MTEIYAGIEKKILIYHSTWHHKTAYFFRVISQTEKTVVVQEMCTKTVRVYEHGGYEDVVPNEEQLCGRPRRMLKTFRLPRLVKGVVESGTNYLRLWDGTPCREDPMY